MTNRERNRSIEKTNELINAMTETYKRAYAVFKQEMSIVDAKMKLTNDEKALFAEFYALAYRADELATLYNIKGKTVQQLVDTVGTTTVLQDIRNLNDRKKDIQGLAERNPTTYRLARFIKEIKNLRNSKR